MNQEIFVVPQVTPVCPGCGSDKWRVWQTITKHSDLEWVDGLGDLVVVAPNPLFYTQEIRLVCQNCRAHFKPQANTSAYHENGGEDEFCWPQRVWEED